LTLASSVLAPTLKLSLFLSPEPQNSSPSFTLAANKTAGGSASFYPLVKRLSAKPSPAVLSKKKTKAGARPGLL
jgi:hypothetical protein